MQSRKRDFLREGISTTWHGRHILTLLIICDGFGIYHLNFRHGADAQNVHRYSDNHGLTCKKQPNAIARVSMLTIGNEYFFWNPMAEPVFPVQ